MDKNKKPTKRRLILSSSHAAPPPSPVPRGTGSRSASNPILSEHIDKSIRIPELILPQHVHSLKAAEISYVSLVSGDDGSLRGMLRSAREHGVFRIVDHGIATEELTSALATCERIFGLMLECCTSYGDHERLVWNDNADRIMEEAGRVVNKQKFQVFRQRVEKVASQLEAMAEELTKVIAQNASKQFKDPILLGKSTMSIYRFHRANLIDRNSSVVGANASQESVPYALSLHLVPESGEFCLHPSHGNLSFATIPDTVIVTIGKELEEWSQGEFKSAQGKLIFKPFLHTNRPSFSLERKWSSIPSNLRNVVRQTTIIISLVDQILILLIAALLYNYLNHIYSQ